MLRYALLGMPPLWRARVEIQALRVYERYLIYSARDGPTEDGGVPLPPPRLRVQVIGSADSAIFVDSGRRQTAFFREILNRNGVVLAGTAQVLDFGCGCGRLARWWTAPGDPAVYGCDPNRELIEWCRSDLPLFNAAVSENDPPLPYTDASFDFIYAMSIFSHLPIAGARAWMAELRRVLKPGGHLLFTTAGCGHAHGLSDDERARFDRGEEVVQFETAIGSNLCLVYHPPEYVSANLLEGLRLIESVPVTGPGLHPESASTQDSFLVQRMGETASA